MYTLIVKLAVYYISLLLPTVHHFPQSPLDKIRPSCLGQWSAYHDRKLRNMINRRCPNIISIVSSISIRISTSISMIIATTIL